MQISSIKDHFNRIIQHLQSIIRPLQTRTPSQETQFSDPPLIMAGSDVYNVNFAAAGLSEDALDSIKDEFSVYPGGHTYEQDKSSDKEDRTENDAMLNLGDLWRTESDPLHEEILLNMEIICKKFGDKSLLLLSHYKKLVPIARDNMSMLMPLLGNYGITGYDFLMGMIQIATRILTLSLNAATAIRKAVDLISAVSADMATMSHGLLAQREAFHESLEHMSSAWNATTSSMTGFMEEVDRRTLELTNLGQQGQASYSAPSTDSHYKAEKKLGNLVKLNPGLTYKSECGILKIDKNSNLGFIASTGKGKTIAMLIMTVKTPRVLEKVLNRDLSQVHDFIISSKIHLSEYETMSPSTKMEYIQALMKATNINLNQWCEE